MSIEESRLKMVGLLDNFKRLFLGLFMQFEFVFYISVREDLSKVNGPNCKGSNNTVHSNDGR